MVLLVEELFIASYFLVRTSEFRSEQGRRWVFVLKSNFTVKSEYGPQIVLA